MRLCVIGGGLAGLSCAATARRLGMEVVLLEASDFNGQRAGEHLAPEAVDLLSTLGFAPKLYDQIATPCNEITSYWGSDEPQFRDSLQYPRGLGLLLERPAFDGLFADFVRNSGVRVVTDARATRLEPVNASWTVHFHHDGAQEYENVDFLVDASGRNSRFASTLGARKIKYDKLIALNLSVPLMAAQDSLWEGRIVVEPHAQGWIYVAGLSINEGIVSAITDSEKVSRGNTAKKVFRAHLSKTRIGRTLKDDVETSIGDLTTCSCQSQVCSNLYGDNWLLVGDAAWSADPLSAQGMLKAIRDGVDAANIIGAFLVGDKGALASYQSRIREDFRTYLADRSKYYRREQRWFEHEFWRRRHNHRLPQMEITLDPNHLLNFSSYDLNPALDRVSVEVPKINCSLLAEVMRTPARAFDMVTRYQQMATTKVSDHEAILTLQAVQQSFSDRSE